MKKILGILLIVFLCSLWGCDARREVYEDAHYYDGAQFEYFGGGNEWLDEAVLLREYSDFQTYIAPIVSESVPEDFRERVASYDENYFEQKMLAIIYHDENSETFEIAVKSVKGEGEAVHIVLSKDMAGYAYAQVEKRHIILVEIPRESEYTAITYRVEEWNSEAWKEDVRVVGKWLLWAAILTVAGVVLVRAVRRKRNS